MKLRTLILLLSTLTLFSFSCSNEEKNEPTPPKASLHIYPSDSIDVNNDGLIDFYTYSEGIGTCDEPQSASTDYRKIGGKQNTTLIRSQNLGIFLNEGDTIRTFVNDYTFPNWFSLGATLISISTHHGVLDDVWKVSSSKSNDYFIAFQLDNVSPTTIGWMLFEFNTLTGAYTIVDKKWTVNPILKIQK